MKPGLLATRWVRGATLGLALAAFLGSSMPLVATESATVTRREAGQLIVTSDGTEYVFPDPGPPGQPPDLTIEPLNGPPATGVFYADRTSFEASLNAMVVDDYAPPVYPPGFGIYDNATFSAFLGETDYFTTGFSNWNFHLDSDRYCAGCNGSFRLSFQTTSLTQAGLGVFGAGFDILVLNPGYFAFVTYSDGTTEEVPLDGQTFFGVTSTGLVASVHVGLSGGASTTEGYIEIDNLTIGSGQPVPVMPRYGFLALGLLLALGGALFLSRSRFLERSQGV